MIGLSFFHGALLITPGPDADIDERKQFEASLINFRNGGKSDAVLAAAVELAALCEQLFAQEAK